MTLFNMFLGMIGPFQIIIILIVCLLLFAFPIYLIFYKKHEAEHNLPIWCKILLIIPSLTLLGTITSLYILFRKKILITQNYINLIALLVTMLFSC